MLLVKGEREQSLIWTLRLAEVPYEFSLVQKPVGSSVHSAKSQK